MMNYRSKVPEEEEEEIMGEVYGEKQAIDRKMKVGRATLKKNKYKKWRNSCEGSERCEWETFLMSGICEQ